MYSAVASKILNIMSSRSWHTAVEKVIIYGDKYSQVRACPLMRKDKEAMKRCQENEIDNYRR